MNSELIKAFLDKRNVFAVVGASRDPGKFGFQVYKDLKSAGYKVYAVNPNSKEILGDKCYSSLKDLPVKPDVVDVVVSPKATEQTVETCRILGITKVWLQPGSETDETVRFCTDNNIDVVYGACVMIERAKHKSNSQ